LAIALFAFAAPPAVAVEVATLYTAQVTLDEQEDDPRSAAYRSALEIVLLRVSGSELAADPELIDLLFPNPASYIVQFRPGAEETLWVSFDGEAIENALREAGQTVWDSDRPLTLVWLAVDWGEGEREIIGADDPDFGDDAARSIDRYRLLRQRVVDTAERRGLPIIFPLLDTEDLQAVSFSDIWGGFDEPLLAASGRYEVDSILVGRFRPGSSQRNQWNYYFSGEERNWFGEPELAVNLLADALAAEFAVSGSAPLESVDLVVAGVESIRAFGSLQALLSELTIVETLAIREVAGDRIVYRVDVRGGAERLRRALQFAGLIEKTGIEGDPFPINGLNSRLEFFYSP
jgi:hypothetical protein